MTHFLKFCTVVVMPVFLYESKSETSKEWRSYLRAVEKMTDQNGNEIKPLIRRTANKRHQ